LSSLGKKSFIAELMPRHPLYVAYLPKEAQEVIGVVHTATQPARHLLEQEGMYYEGFVDIFDAGPVLQARVKDLRAVRDSELVQVSVSDTPVQGATAPTLVANTSIHNYRIIVSEIASEHGAIVLTKEQTSALQCPANGQVRVVPLNIA
jgi:arginine N-succinyltransferase